MQFASEFQRRRRTLLIALAAVGTAAAVPTAYALLTPDSPAPDSGLRLTDELREYVDHFPRNGGYRTTPRCESTAAVQAQTGNLMRRRSIDRIHTLPQLH